jgi:hypothetical protein
VLGLLLGALLFLQACLLLLRFQLGMVLPAQW